MCRLSVYPKKITAVEIQENACDMLNRSLELNGLTERIEVLNSDLRELKVKLASGSYDRLL